jgi:hypothetical protein
VQFYVVLGIVCGRKNMVFFHTNGNDRQTGVFQSFPNSFQTNVL